MFEMILGLKTIKIKQYRWRQHTVPAAVSAGASVLGASYGDDVYFVGGKPTAAPISTTMFFWKYNTLTQEWTELVNSFAPRNFGAIAVVDDNIYCMGGITTEYLADVMIYNITTSTWSVGVPYPTQLLNSTAVAVDKKIYVISNGIPSPGSKLSRCFDTVTGVWSSIADLPAARSAGDAFQLDDKNSIYFTMGLSSNSTMSNATYRYNILLNTWTTVTSAPVSICMAGCAVLDNMAIFNGGLAQGAIFTAGTWIYSGSGWKTGPVLSPTPATRYTKAMVTCNGKLFMYGGRLPSGATKEFWEYSAS